jgi:hypothetical protein
LAICPRRQTGQNNADLLLRRKLPPGQAADLPDNLLRRSFTGPGFCPICAPSMATMGQKPSLPQPAVFVSGADAGQCHVQTHIYNIKNEVPFVCGFYFQTTNYSTNCGAFMTVII